MTSGETILALVIATMYNNCLFCQARLSKVGPIEEPDRVGPLGSFDRDGHPCSC